MKKLDMGVLRLSTNTDINWGGGGGGGCNFTFKRAC